MYENSTWMDELKTREIIVRNQMKTVFIFLKLKKCGFIIF